MGKTTSNDPNVVTQEVVAANGQAVDIVQYKKYDGTVAWKVNKDGFISEPQGTAGLSASYIIFKIGSTYYVKNGKTGAIDYSGADASTIIQAAIDALPLGIDVNIETSGGGLIYIMPGQYTIASTITVDHNNIRIVGAGPSTLLDWSTDGVCIRVSAVGTLHRNEISDIAIRALGAAASGASAVGVYTNQTNLCKLNRLSVYFFGAGKAIHCQATVTASIVTEIIDPYFYGCNRGIHLDGANVTTVKVSGGTMTGTGTYTAIGIDCDNSGSHKIDGVVTEIYGTGIRLNGQHTYVADCYIEDSLTYGIQLTANATASVLLGNKFIGSVPTQGYVSPPPWPINCIRLDHFGAYFTTSAIADHHLMLANHMWLTGLSVGGIETRMLALTNNDIFQLGSPTFALSMNAAGIYHDGTGMKHARITTGVVGPGAEAAITVTWGTAFANANYTVSAAIVDATAAAAALQIIHIDSITAGTVVVRVKNSSAGNLTGTVHAIGIHD